jgi:hypothetical protein
MYAYTVPELPSCIRGIMLFRKEIYAFFKILCVRFPIPTFYLLDDPRRGMRVAGSVRGGGMGFMRGGRGNMRPSVMGPSPWSNQGPQTWGGPWNQGGGMGGMQNAMMGGGMGGMTQMGGGGMGMGMNSGWGNSGMGGMSQMGGRPTVGAESLCRCR